MGSEGGIGLLAMFPPPPLPPSRRDFAGTREADSVLKMWIEGKSGPQSTAKRASLFNVSMRIL